MAAIDLIYFEDDLSTIAEEDEPHGDIYEWYLWSYFNMIFGFFIMGFIAICFSLRTTMHKEADNNLKAHLWSYITLLWNILATCIGLGLTFYAVSKQ